MIDLIGESRMLNGNTLIVNVLGNHLPEENKGYNPCLEVEFDNHDSAWQWYCKEFKITVNEECLKDSPNKGFKKVDFKDCKFVEMTTEEVQSEVKKYLDIYEN